MLNIAALIFSIASLPLAAYESILIEELKTAHPHTSYPEDGTIEDAIQEYGIHPEGFLGRLSHRYILHSFQSREAYPVLQKTIPKYDDIVKRMSKEIGVQKPIITLSPSLGNAIVQKIPGLPAIITIGIPYLNALNDEELKGVTADLLREILHNTFLILLIKIISLLSVSMLALQLIAFPKLLRKIIDTKRLPTIGFIPRIGLIIALSAITYAGLISLVKQYPYAIPHTVDTQEPSA